MTGTEFRGTVQGAAALKYAGFTYLKPLPARLTAENIYPERVHFAHEYPRFVLLPRAPDVRAVELADYTMKVSDPSSNGRCLVQVLMLPNQYTAATAPRLVFEIEVAYPLTLRRECRDEILSIVFRRRSGEERSRKRV